MKKVTIGCAPEHVFLKPESMFPHTKPISSGTIVATRAMKGILASPVAPNAIKVKKGPSFNERMEIAPVSVASPNCDEREI